MPTLAAVKVVAMEVVVAGGLDQVVGVDEEVGVAVVPG
jgi:hypothetical protein